MRLNLNIELDDFLNEKMEMLMAQRFIKNRTQIVREALAEYLKKFAHDNYKSSNESIISTHLSSSINSSSDEPKGGHAAPLGGDLATEDLPELTPEIIQSQLVRFPKVSPEQYRGIIRHLLMLRERGELKNAEATAYGLCKRIQAGRPMPPMPDGSAAEPTEPAHQQTNQGVQGNHPQELSTNDPRHPLYIALHPFAPLPKRQANQG